MTDPGSPLPLADGALSAIEEAYARDQPAPMPDDPSAALTPAMLLRPHPDARRIDDPAVLSLIARWDPSEALSMAALVRLVGCVASSDQALPTLLEVHNETRHALVQQAVVGLLKPQITRSTVESLGRLAREAINRSNAVTSLDSLLQAIADPEAPRQSPVPRLLALAEVSGIDNDGLSGAMQDLIGSTAIPLPTKLLALDDLDRLPDPVSEATRAFVLSLPEDEWTQPLRRAVVTQPDDAPMVLVAALETAPDGAVDAPVVADADPDTVDPAPAADLSADGDVEDSAGETLETEPMIDLGALLTHREAPDRQLPLFDAPAVTPLEEAPAATATPATSAEPKATTRQRRFAWPEEDEYPSRRPLTDVADLGADQPAALPDEAGVENGDPTLLALLRRLQRSQETS